MRRAALRLLGLAALLGADLAGAQTVQNVVLRNSFNPIGAGARGLGMGGAFIAVADDGTAASFNPAGLAHLRRTEIALVGFESRLTSDLSFTRVDDTAGSQRTASRHRAPDFAGLALPFRLAGRTLTVQVSYQRSIDLFGEGTAITQDTFPLADLGIDPEEIGLPRSASFATVLSDIRPVQKGAFHTFSLSSGYQLNSRLALGVSLNYWRAEWDAAGSASFRGIIPVGPRAQPIELFRSERVFDQEQRLRAFNLTTGFLLKYPRLSIGGVLRLPFAGDYNLLETGHQTEFRLGQPPGPGEDIALEATTRLHWPLSAGIGLAVRPVRGLTLAADYTRSHWSRTFIEDLPQGALLTPRPPIDPDTGLREAPSYDDRGFFDLQPASQTTAVDTAQVRAGGEYLVVFSKLIVPLRGGWFRDRSPVVQVGSGQGRRIQGWTAGTGLNFNRVVLDVAFERRKSSSVIGLIFRGGELVEQARAPREDVREDRLVASLIYRFGADDDPLKRALRFLFVGGDKDKDDSSTRDN